MINSHPLMAGSRTRFISWELKKSSITSSRVTGFNLMMKSWKSCRWPTARTTSRCSARLHARKAKTIFHTMKISCVYSTCSLHRTNHSRTFRKWDRGERTTCARKGSGRWTSCLWKTGETFASRPSRRSKTRDKLPDSRRISKKIKMNSTYKLIRIKCESGKAQACWRKSNQIVSCRKACSRITRYSRLQRMNTARNNRLKSSLTPIL